MKKGLVITLTSILTLTLMTSIAIVSVVRLAGGVSSAKLYVEPSSICEALSLGQRFFINITVIDIINMYSYDIKLGYDAEVLNVVGVAAMFPEENLPTPNFDVDNVIGLVWINVTYDGEPVTTDVPLTLGIIEFKVQGYGETLLNLYDTKIVDSEGDLITHDVEGGFFNNALEGDINNDGIVDIFDLVIAAAAFGSYPGHPKWNPIADLNQDGTIDIFDIVVIGVNFGKTY